MKPNKKQIQQIKTYLADKPVNRAYLFGSYVRGEAKTGSDVAILVESDYTQPVGLVFVQMKLELEELLHKEVDVEIPGRMVRNFHEKAKIYAKEKRVNLSFWWSSNF